MNINFEKKDLYWISFIFIFIIGVSLIIAFNPDYPLNPISPSLQGHTNDELGLPNCAEGQVLKKVSGAWACSNDQIESGTGVQCRAVVNKELRTSQIVCCNDDEVAIAWASNDWDVHTYYSTPPPPPIIVAGMPSFNPNNPKCIAWYHDGPTRQVMCCKKL